MTTPLVRDTDQIELPAPEEALVRQSSGEQAAMYIRRLIFDGLLRQGDRVPQDNIARALGLSRIPVREALLTLEHEGWITIKPRRGAFIGALDSEVVRDHYELYGLIYGFAARRATVRQTPEFVERLVEQRRELLRDPQPRTVWRHNRQFHSAILQMARSPRLRSVLRTLAGIVPGNFFELVPGSIDVELVGTAGILRCIQRMDPDGAAAAYAEMMRQQGDLVIDLFQRRGMFAPAGVLTERESSAASAF